MAETFFALGNLRKERPAQAATNKHNVVARCGAASLGYAHHAVISESRGWSHNQLQRGLSRSSAPAPDLPRTSSTGHRSVALVKLRDRFSDVFRSRRNPEDASLLI